MKTAFVLTALGATAALAQVQNIGCYVSRVPDELKASFAVSHVFGFCRALASMAWSPTHRTILVAAVKVGAAIAASPTLASVFVTVPMRPVVAPMQPTASSILPLLLALVSHAIHQKSSPDCA